MFNEFIDFYMIFVRFSINCQFLPGFPVQEFPLNANSFLDSLPRRFHKMPIPSRMPCPGVSGKCLFLPGCRAHIYIHIPYTWARARAGPGPGPGPMYKVYVCICGHFIQKGINIYKRPGGWWWWVGCGSDPQIWSRGSPLPYQLIHPHAPH